MMATTMIPPTATPKPPPPSGELRFVSVRADLMPGEVISSRQALVVRRQVLIALGVVVVLLIGWYALSWWQTRSANSDLDSAQRQGISLQNQQQEFAPLVSAQALTTTIQTQLQSLMVGDLSWKTMLTTLRAKAPAGVQITGVTGSVTAGAAAASNSGAAGGSSVLNTTGSLGVGQLTITGNAPDKRTVAAFADRLNSVPGLAAPFISNVQGDPLPLTFTINAVITSDALGGRYATAVPGTAPTGGQ
jgi:Tfp pilus assembly protein PilN